jgi:hypothetical protein
MAHFAEINSSNLVLRVVVIDNNDVNASGGDQSVGAEEKVKSIVPFTTGNRWVQTSYNNNFRKQYAGIGYTFDSVKKINLSHHNLMHLGHLMLMTTGKHLLHIQQLQLTEIMYNT